MRDCEKVRGPLSSTESLARRVSSYNRDRKWRTFLEWAAPTAAASILDVGVSDEEYSPVDNYLEKHYPHPARVTVLSIEHPARFIERYPETKVVRYGGESFPFKDDVFDLCWSNAVLEHVGARDAQVRFVREIHRVARAALLTTPNRWFPVEVHTRLPFLHYLPKPLFDAILVRIGKSFATGSYMNLLSLGALKSILEEAKVTNYRIVKNRMLFFTMDFTVLIGRPESFTGKGQPARLS